MSKKKQTEIAKEVLEQQEIRRLRKELKLLTRLPNDFRDIDPGSPDWEAFADITKRRREMEDWSNGLVLCLEEPNEQEKRILGEVQLTTACSWHNLSTAQGAYTCWDWFTLLGLAQENNASFIYLPEEDGELVKALNLFCSRIGACFRIKGQLLSPHSGKPLGVVH